MSNLSSVTTGAAASKALWAAIGVLTVAVVGLGGALYYQRQQASQPVPEAAPAALPPVAEPARPAVTEKAAPATPAPRKPVARQEKKTAPAPAVTSAPAQSKAAAKTAPVCADCATVTAVTPVEREGQTSGAGAVAGGVLGAIVGNQIGQGQGKDVATIIGAVGGGIAGNQVEKKMKKVTVYQVELRMDDGSHRSLELDTPVGVGARVRVEGNNLVPLPANN